MSFICFYSDGVPFPTEKIMMPDGSFAVKFDITKEKNDHINAFFTKKEEPVTFSEWAEHIKNKFDIFKEEVKIPEIPDPEPITSVTEDESILISMKDDYGSDCLRSIDFSDHKTLNYMFRQYFHFTDFEYLKIMEKALKRFEKEGDLSLCTFFSMLFPYGKEISLWDEISLMQYRWDDEHPFDYNLNVVPPNEEGKVEYYPVFSSAPIDVNKTK